MKSHYCFSLLLSCFVLLPAGWGQTSQPTPPKPAPMQTGILLVRSDKAASLSIDGKDAGDLAVGGFLKVSAVAGDHFIEAIEKDGACKWKKKVTIPVGMQVAEDVDFAAACPPKPDAGALAPSSVNSAPPATAAIPAAVDPKIKEAQELYDQGCRLYFLDRFSEAVALLEKAESPTPDPYATGECLNFARSQLNVAQKSLNKFCNSSQIPNDSKKKQTQAIEKQQEVCRNAKTILGVNFGDFGGFSSLNYLIQEGEQGRNTVNTPDNYTLRAMYEYALGNSTAALNDLQTALDGTRRYWENSSGGTVEDRELRIGQLESDIYLKRAVIQASIGNNEAAAQDCKVALASKYFLVLPERWYCTRLTEAPSTSDSAQHGTSMDHSTGAHSVDDVIGRIQAGQHSAMPQAQALGGIGSGSPRLTIENGTPYALNVYLSGPEKRSVSIPAGGTSVVDLQAGAFKLAAEIPDSSVIPFYGEQTFSSGTAYMEKFYIQRVQ